MTNPAFAIDPEDLLFDGGKLKALGSELHQSYVSGDPYPHICIDDAFPEELLARVADETIEVKGDDGSFSGKHEMLKIQRTAERLPFYSRSFLYALNSRPFLQFLENMTGIKGLIPDPYFIGGGLHETKTGGFLNIHADFNHHEPLNLERRLNILIYLNQDWKEEYGGSFEIWDTPMTKLHGRWTPSFNRFVAFSTASDTMHGNPEPVSHPDGLSRRSLALYYYTATWDDTRQRHTTIFKGRPGTKDASGFGDQVNRVVDDVLPPILNRQVKKVRRKLGI